MYHLQINHHEKELNYFDRAIYNSMINYCWFLRNLHIFACLNFLLDKRSILYYISPERIIYEEFKYAVELLIGSKGEWDMDIAKFHFCNPQNPNIFSPKILVPEPYIKFNAIFEFLIKFSFQKMYTFDMVGLRFFKLNCLEAREVQNFQNRVT